MKTIVPFLITAGVVLATLIVYRMIKPMLPQAVVNLVGI